jgi:hypothetical protein
MSGFQKQNEPRMTRSSRAQSFPDYTENSERFHKSSEGITVRSKLQSREAPNGTTVRYYHCSNP